MALHTPEPLNVSSPQYALAFDDVLLLPGHSHVLPSQCDVSTQLGGLPLRVPVLSAAMDTVTEARTAIALALMGGIGVLHKNCAAQEQASFVRKVKKFQHAVIASPLTIRDTQTIEEVYQLIDETGVTGFPVVNDKGVLVGMCTGRDIRYVADAKLKVAQVMSAPAKSLPVGTTPQQAREFFQKYKVEKLPLIDAQGRIGGLITSRDLRHATEHPQALRDADGSLCVAAAVGVGPGEQDRADVLVKAGVDCLAVDSAHGHSEGVLGMLRHLRKLYPSLTLIGGNVATGEGALAVAEAGANIVKVGMGPGSICTTRIVSGVGVPQLSAVMSVSQALRAKHPKVGIVADGGIRYSGDVSKALAAGAHAVMIGSLLAGTDESPGETILFQGRSYKQYRGMGSLGAMKRGSRDRYGQQEVKDAGKLVPEGVEARVPYRGSLKQVVEQLVGGLRSGMGYVGAASLAQLREKARFQQISPGGLRESHVHNVTITAEAPNYSGGSGE